MNKLKETLKFEMDESDKEFGLIKKTLIDIKDKDLFEIFSKYSIPIIYANWEGFFKEAILAYYNFINRNDIEIDTHILTQILIHNEILKDEPIKAFKARKNLIERIKNVFENPNFKNQRPKISDLGLKEANKFLEENDFKIIELENGGIIHQLANERHKIVHGDKTDKTYTIEEISMYIDIVENAIQKLSESVIDKSEMLLE